MRGRGGGAPGTSAFVKKSKCNKRSRVRRLSAVVFRFAILSVRYGCLVPGLYEVNQYTLSSFSRQAARFPAAHESCKLQRCIEAVQRFHDRSPLLLP